MEHLSPPTDEASPAKATEPGRLQRLIRSALTGATLALSAGGDSAPVQKFSPTHPSLPTQTANLHDAHEYGPSLTPEEHIIWLSQRLKTPEELARFLQSHMRYEKDEEGGYAQSPSETVMTAQKTTDGKMTGDCKDFAILSQELLAEMGILSQVAVLDLADGIHAVCLWAEKNHHGKYHAYCLDNGTLEKDDSFSRGIGQPPKLLEGYSSIQEALNAVLEQYYEKNGNRCRIHPWKICVMRKVGGHYLATDTTILAFDPDLPTIARFHHIDLAVFGTTILAALAIYRSTRKGHAKDKKVWFKESLTTFRWY